jgi:hypothetical protein
LNLKLGRVSLAFGWAEFDGAQAKAFGLVA